MMRRQIRFPDGPARVLRLALLACILLAAGACSGPDGERSVSTPHGATPAATSGLSPSPAASATLPATATTQPTVTPTTVPTRTPTPAPSPTPTATVEPTATATPSPTPVPLPAGQEVLIPDVDATYQLDISNLDFDSGQVTASEVIAIAAFRGARPERIFLQVTPAAYGFFTLDAARLQGAPIEPDVLNGGDTLALDLPADLAPPIEIALDFRLFVGTESTGWAGTAVDGDVLRLGYWFPVISDDHGFSDTLDPSYTRTASYRVSVTLDPDITFAATGTITDRQTLDDGQVRTFMKADDVRDFALVLARGFEVDTGVTAGGVTIELYSLRSSESRLSGDEARQRRQNIIGWAIDAVDQLSALVGPYPYPTLRYVDAGPDMPGGVEFPNLIYINPNYPDLDRLIYHETSHQWMYGIIGNRTLLDGWIDEGGAEFFERGLPTGFTEVPEIPEGGYLYPLDSTYLELPAQPRATWYYSIYEQGARFYDAVLAQMGADSFWAAMHEIYDRFKFGIVTPWDMLTTWQRHSPSDLRPLFHEYLRYEWIDAVVNSEQ